jgi:thymidylate synthase
MPFIEGESADSVWQKALNMIMADGALNVSDSRTGATREVLHAHMRVTNPRQRWVVSRFPPVNPAFAIADAVWMVLGREDSAFLNAWNSQLPKFAGEGAAYHGAYGFRLRHRFGLDQLERVYQVLSSNSSTRQAVLQLWDPAIDLPSPDGTPVAADIPCNVCALLKVRNGRLDWMQILRSNDLMLGAPYNFIQFTTLQEVVAGWIGVEIGEYHHLSDSLHIYERDLPNVYGSHPVSEIANTDSLALSRAQSLEVFAQLGEFIERLADPGITQGELSSCQSVVGLPQSYRNLLCVVVAEAARRRLWTSSSNDSIEACTNPTLRYVWRRWCQRFVHDQGGSSQL